MCATELSADFWTCGGFCSGRFCFRCSGLDSDMRSAVGHNAFLHWMCSACSGMMIKARFTKAITSVNAAYEGIIESLKTEIRDNILSEIRSELQNTVKRIPEIVANTPIRNVQRRTFGSAVQTSAKRRRGNDDLPVGPPRKLVCGTDGQSTSSTDVIAIPERTDENTFWLYLSGVSPKAPDEKVVEMVKNKLASDDLTVVKLVPRGKDTNNLTFVSFKVGMKLDLKEKAMSPDTWPVGIRFREFENYRSSRPGFWNPTEEQPDSQIPSTSN